MNVLFQDDSSDSADVADELNEFFRFMVWNDLSEEEEEQKQSFTENEWESSISDSDLFTVFDDLDIITDDDDDEHDGYHCKHSTPSKVFSSAQEAILEVPSRLFPKAIIIENCLVVILVIVIVIGPVIIGCCCLSSCQINFQFF